MIIKDGIVYVQVGDTVGFPYGDELGKVVLVTKEHCVVKTLDSEYCMSWSEIWTQVAIGMKMFDMNNIKVGPGFVIAVSNEWVILDINDKEYAMLKTDAALAHGTVRPHL